MQASIAQSTFDDPHFIAPMDIDLIPSSNFAEFRRNHFHSGVDLKTNGRTGYNIRSVQDGYVSRIKVSPWGYGNALYIDHPSGHTTVYAHLQEFSKEIQAFALERQYAEKSFSIDYYLKPGQLPVKQGQVIGLSGNTGGSTAPHLHYEVRRSKDQVALDPEAFGLNIPDATPPTIRGIRLYRLDNEAKTSNYNGRAKGFVVEGAKGKYRVRSGQTVAANGTIGIGVHARDKFDVSPNNCGVRKVELFVDGELHFTADLNSINFGTTRFLNAHMDHRLYHSHRMHYHKCFKRGNNKLDIYEGDESMGAIEVVSGNPRNVKVIVHDANGNNSTLEFILDAPQPDAGILAEPPTPTGTLIPAGQTSTFQEKGFAATFTPKVLYEDLYLDYRQSKSSSTMLSDVHHFGDPIDAVQSRFNLSITPTRWIKDMSKVLVVRKNGKGRLKPAGGTLSGKVISTRVRDFGSYFLMADTTAPKINVSDIKPDMSGRDKFNVWISDDLSGVEEWTAKLDGEWIMMEYEAKRSRLTHSFDKYSEGKGKRVFEITVVDDRGNRNSVQRVFQR